MASAWTRNGPISLPPRSLAYGAGVLLFGLAVLGITLGWRAAWREDGGPEVAGSKGQSADGAQTIVAGPIVDLPTPPANADAAVDEGKPDAAAAQESRSQQLAAQTAAAQAVQAKAAKPAGDIDQILTSASEKPAAPVKPATDETAPGAPVKSDVPF